jgi:hypothetical protein
MSTGKRYALRITVILIVLALAWFKRDLVLEPPAGGVAGTSVATPEPATPGLAPEGAIERAFAARRSGVLVEAEGEVVKVLPDDREGSRHQRLIVELASGHSVLIAHNIDLAPRAPAREGDGIRFRGDFEWSDKGGTVHWTHHDPDRRREGGWIEHDGQRYE